MPDHFVLVVFNLSPENVKVFKIPVHDDVQTLGFYRRCHHKYVNATEDIDQDVYDFLCKMSDGSHDEFVIYDASEPEVDFDKLVLAPFHPGIIQIIVCGFIM